MNLARGAIVLSICALAACSQGDGKLRYFASSGGGPEEFDVVPTKELQTPASYAELPAPTPGGSNLADPRPLGDAVAALGGRASALEDQGVASADGALVTYAARAGVDPAIRATLAAEDEDFRRRRARFGNLRPFKLDQYYRAYEDQAIDPRLVARYWTGRGYTVPSYPPAD
ncbi:Beta-barrel assembly machine subunit BamF [Pseudooceanicola antarcticus]|uniref:Beta-barrel assembly machine subunit BamF n=1 Tax=Pseudooceanicola antarcticus TaxID=1247613 RepID=A0A285HN50_9RHOB|nr:DUF3035 domain-containing protein [Pseudooceanicola antarcticus]PJE27777.1 DUF3035 domain-containing protein [Pseudooceanicola antarcticus]SNY37162.1 Beta-barrel assembly machine subunit BamF [Pseudooceanicola antarcticus]